MRLVLRSETSSKRVVRSRKIFPQELPADYPGVENRAVSLTTLKNIKKWLDGAINMKTEQRLQDECGEEGHSGSVGEGRCQEGEEELSLNFIPRSGACSEALVPPAEAWCRGLDGGLRGLRHSAGRRLMFSEKV